MNLVDVFIDIFWDTATAFIPLIVPCVVIILIMKFAHAFLFDKGL